MEWQLLDRIRLNKKRLLNTDDTYENLYEKDASMTWPGDFVGRYSLALSSLYVALDDEKEKEEVFARLKKVVDERQSFVNDHHYFGKLVDDTVINEQQLSGNSWYIRSLVSYYRLTKDKKIFEEILDIVENFLLKVAPHYAHYPMKEERDAGQVSGHLEETPIHGFLLSSDIGCAFILLDGFVDAYSVTKDERLKSAIMEIIEIFQKIDYVKLHCQTHATLTCARAILRFYHLTKIEKYLEMVLRIFDDYETYGMTLDYQNVNWFCRTDSWTEPCCVVDSFILCHDLYLETKNEKYLELFQKIALNGIRTFQRNNGGAGCTKIAVKKDAPLSSFMYEAWFCCSMRLGEGLKYLSSARCQKMSEGNYLMMYPEKYEKDGLKIEADYYDKKVIKIKSEQSVKISFYIPESFSITSSNVPYQIDGHLLHCQVNAQEEGFLQCDVGIHKQKEIYFVGDWILTQKEKHTGKIWKLDGKDYSLLLSSADESREELEKISQYF